MPFDAASFLASLTDHPGVYRMIDDQGGVLYVGKAKNLKKRLASYFRTQLPSVRIAHMVSQIASIDITVTRTEAEALLLENNLIKALLPRYNILFRDDKSYPYIVIGKGDFPRLGFYRGNPNRQANYFGPYPSAFSVRETIALLQKTFQLRNCEEAVFNNRSRPCLLYQIKRCSGSCVKKISLEDYAIAVHMACLFLEGKQQEVILRLKEAMEKAAYCLAFEEAAAYRDQISALHHIQEKQFVSNHEVEDADIVVLFEENGQHCVNLAMVRGGRHLGDRPFFPNNATAAPANEVLDAFLRQHYAAHNPPAQIFLSPIPEDSDEIALLFASLAEKPVRVQAARRLIHKTWVQMALKNASLALLSRRQQNTQQEARLVALQEALSLNDLPDRIECFDISHTQGEAAVASCVVYEGRAMKSSDYRRFNLKNITPGDDYAAIHQAVSRRYDGLVAGEADAKIPDLILIDGGLGQVRAALTALEELGLNTLLLIGVAKGVARKAGEERLIFTDGREIRLPPEDAGLHLIQEVRDEAHRFAISGHRGRRAKPRKTSTLEEIPGIGAVKRKALILHFGGLQGVKTASIAQLASVQGINQVLAEEIYQRLH